MMFRVAQIIAIILIVSCSGGLSDKQRKALREENKNREIKKVNSGKIIGKAYEQGRAISAATQKVLVASLSTALESGNLDNAVTYCYLNALPITDSLASFYKTDIRRVSFKSRNKANAPSTYQKEILEAYAYGHANGEKLSDNVQQFEEGESLLYTKPILLKSPLCLNCHGTRGKTMTIENADFIRSLYPMDSATGYELGDLRGMWSIKLSRKNIVLSMDE